MKLSKKEIGILVEQQYNDYELWYPYYRFKEEGATVHLIGPEKGKIYPGKYGCPAKTDLAINEVSAKNYDCVIIPGGFAPDFMRRIPQMIEFVRQANENGKLIAGICHAGWMLISAGCVKDKKVTCYFAIKDDLINAGGNFMDQEVVKDGNLITSRTPDDLPAFCRTIIETLAK